MIYRVPRSLPRLFDEEIEDDSRVFAFHDDRHDVMCRAVRPVNGRKSDLYPSLLTN